MNKTLKTAKGTHPGVILEHELKKRKLAKGRFALSVNEFPQTLVAITKGKRKMNIPLSLKIEKALDMEEGYFMMLQLYYDIAQEKNKHTNDTPNLNKLRSVLFWDTRIDSIDWEKQKNAVIKRVFERGNETEKKEIIRFYGKANVHKVLKAHGK